MENKHRRILWLINHTTLRKFEVPLLIKLGFEVFVPKIIPPGVSTRSGDVTYEFDHTLTLSADEIGALNQVDFYHNEYPDEAINIINKKFDVAIFGFFEPMIYNLVRRFKGKLFVRAFGIPTERKYMDIIVEIFGKRFLHELNKVHHRFWFAQCYSEIYKNEYGIFHERALTLPLGLPKSMEVNKNTWRGDIPKILFVCPGINTHIYYKTIYNQFTKHFGRFPHVIGGGQTIPVNDPNVMGFLSREKYDEIITGCKVMFYHSQEPRHLHYHPLEAFIIGMPVIYMQGGLLESLGGKQQPGLCTSVKEARQKIQRILNNDQKFINEIRNMQVSMLEKFSEEYCYQQWTEKFLPLLSQKITQKTEIKIAVILPQAFKGAMLEAFMNVILQLQKGAEKTQDNLIIMAYCLRHSYNLEQDLALIYQKKNIHIREFNFIDCSYQEAEIAMEMVQNGDTIPKVDSLYLIEDNFKRGIDCDFWLFISDRLEKPIVPLRSYATIVYDYAQRYIPEMFANWHEQSFIEFATKARLIITTTEQTKQDAINYAGAFPGKVVCTGIQYEPMCNTQEAPTKKITETIQKMGNYCLWPTSLQIHKNIKKAVVAIEQYLQEGGKYKFIITGVQMGKLNPANTCKVESWIKKIRKYIRHSSILTQNLIFLDYLDRSDFSYVLKHAKFIFHPVLMDNGTFSVIDAAVLEIPSTSANYPQMQYINDEFNLKMHFFDQHQVMSMSNALFYMENNHNEQAKKLPTLEFLHSKNSVESAQKFWEIIRSQLC